MPGPVSVSRVVCGVGTAMTVDSRRSEASRSHSAPAWQLSCAPNGVSPPVLRVRLESALVRCASA
jgi:hypothetical protein